MSLLKSIGILRSQVDVIGKKLEAFDWKPLTDLVEKKKNCDNMQAVAIVEEFKKFIFIKFIDNDYDAKSYSPSFIIDEIWHLFLLFPKDYSRLCSEVLGSGELLDHNPLATSDSDQNTRYQNTLKRYELLFKESPPSAYWDDNVVDSFSANHSSSSDIAEYTSKRDQLKLESSSSYPSTHFFSMQIFYKNTIGIDFALNVSPSDSILYIKQLIERIDGSPICVQRLIYAGRQLEDDRTLSDYNVRPEATLQLVLRLRGC